ncbi:MAG: transglycosylase SLT domain-containing protein [Candidatus Aminicenantes bacterium]|nr:MAG: transglycosylase SLT domain-containing protein [Candidatus Aminicenantes bacterium]
MKNRLIIISTSLLIIFLGVTLFLISKNLFQKGNLKKHEHIVKKMQEGGKIHTLLPDIDSLLERPFLQEDIRNYGYILVGYINYRKANYKDAHQAFSHVKFVGQIPAVRDYIYYWWGTGLWELYQETNEPKYLKQAKECFKKVIYTQSSPMKVNALFDYIRSSYYADDYSFYDALPGNFDEAVKELRTSAIPEFLYLMAEANRLKGNKEKSIRYLLRLWKTYPYLSWREKAQQKLEQMGKPDATRYPFISAGELLDIYELLYQKNKSNDALVFIEKRLENLKGKVRGLLGTRVNLLYGKIYYRLHLEAKTRSQYNRIKSKSKYYLNKVFASRNTEVKVQAAYYLMLHAKNSYHFSTLKRIVANINSPRLLESKYFEETVYLAGFDFMRKKRYREAIPIYKVVLKKAKENNSRYDQALWRLHWCYYHLNQYQNALNILEKLRVFNEWEEYALYWTAYIYHKMGNMDAAKTLYRELLTTSGFTYYGILAADMLKRYFDMEIDLKENLKEFVPLKVGRIEDLNRRNRYNLLKKNGLYEFAAIELKTYLKEANITSEAEEETWKSYGSELAKLYYYSSQYINAGIHLYQAYKEYVLKGGKNIPQWFWNIYYPLFYKNIIDKYADRYGVSKNFLYAFIRQESFYEPYARSSAGAIGVMQIMPGTGKYIFKDIALSLGLKEYSPQLLFQPEINIPMGIYHLRNNVYDKIENYIRQKSIKIPVESKEEILKALAIAGYNAGLGRAYRWVRETTFANNQELIDQIDITETRRYVKLVFKHLFLYSRYVYKDQKDRALINPSITRNK